MIRIKHRVNKIQDMVGLSRFYGGVEFDVVHGTQGPIVSHEHRGKGSSLENYLNAAYHADIGVLFLNVKEYGLLPEIEDAARHFEGTIYCFDIPAPEWPLWIASDLKVLGRRSEYDEQDYHNADGVILDYFNGAPSTAMHKMEGRVVAKIGEDLRGRKEGNLDGVDFLITKVAR